MSGGYGTGWGLVPWGGASPGFVAPPSDFDIFCFFDSPSSMGQILIDPSVSTVDAGGQFLIDGNNDLLVRSGGAISADDAQLDIAAAIPDSWTLEFTVLVDAIPTDFTDLVNRHIFVGASSTVGACAGFFISALGLAYVGGTHNVAGNLQVDSTLQVLPGSNAYISTGHYIVVRVAIDDTTGTLYLYVTDKSAVLATGHVLRAILPVFNATDLATAPSDRAYLSVRGTITQPTAVRFDEICMSSHLLVPNLAPIANAGLDKSIQLCEVIRLDGSASFDPEGANLLYRWLLVDSPQDSQYVIAESDGRTIPIDLTGFTNKFYSASLGVLIDPVVVDDVLLLAGVSRVITATGTDGDGYFLQFGAQNIPDSLSAASFRILRQQGLYQADTVSPSFFPDTPGFYRFELIVSDGQLPSAPSIVVFNILESLLPRGVVPDVSFLFGLMSDFWSLVEDRERITTLWSGTAQVVAGELLSLWQHDYAKSLRDIQRQFTRKWLHYDLLLPEPIPELTTTRLIWGGVYSVPVDETVTFSGGYSVSGTVTVATAIWGDTPLRSFTFVTTNVTSVDELANLLDIRLKLLDPRFAARAVHWTAPKCAVQVTAPFGFSITTELPLVDNLLNGATGVPLFAQTPVANSVGLSFFVDVQNGIPSGGINPGLDSEMDREGAAIGTNTYRINAKVQGVVENDLLIIDQIAYRVAKVLVSVSTEQTDIITKEPLAFTPSRTWQIASYITSELLDFWNGLVTYGDLAYLEVTEVASEAPSSAQFYLLDESVVLGVNEVLPNRLAFRQNGGLPVDPDSSARSLRLAKVLRRQYVPVSPLLLDVPTLSAKIVVDTQADEEAVLRRNVDFTLEQFRSGAAIKFVVLDNNAASLDVWEAAAPPNRLWAEFTYLDNRPTIEQNFGIPVEFTLDNLAALSVELDYLSAVRGLWYAYFNGPTLSNLRIGTQILLGLPFAEEAGVIEELRTDFSPTLGRLLIRDSANAAIVRSYTYPKALALEINPATGLFYAIGDSVNQFAPLVKGVSIVDYIKDPRWFQGILTQGVFNEVEKYFKFLVQIDSAAFNLAAVLAVRDFVLKIKPTYTYPLFVIELSGGTHEDDIVVTDQITASATLRMTDQVCGGLFGNAGTFDDFRGDGTVASQFDASIDPADPAPTFPTSDSPILWGFDKEWLCPEDSVFGDVATRFAAPAPILFGQCFLIGAPYTRFLRYVKTNYSGSISIPVDPNDPSGGVSSWTGTITRVRIRSKGLLGTPTIPATVQVIITGVPTNAPQATTLQQPGGSADVTLTTPGSVVPGDVVTVIVAAAPSSPLDFVEVTVYLADVAVWNIADTLTTGSYLTTRPMS